MYVRPPFRDVLAPAQRTFRQRPPRPSSLTSRRTARTRFVGKTMLALSRRVAKVRSMVGYPTSPPPGGSIGGGTVYPEDDGARSKVGAASECEISLAGRWSPTRSASRFHWSGGDAHLDLTILFASCEDRNVPRARGGQLRFRAIQPLVRGVGSDRRARCSLHKKKAL